MKKVIIIGAGVTGLCSAYYLQKEGFQVQIIDREAKDNLSCSYGNAGMIVPSHIIPLAAPGMISQGMKWMFNSRSPFYIKPRLSLSLFSWMFKFFKSSTKKNVDQSMPLLKDYNSLSQSLFEEMHSSGDFEFSYAKKGLLMLYKKEATEQEELEVAEKAHQVGLEANNYSAKELHKLEPEVKLNVRGGLHFPGDAHLTPNEFIGNLKGYLVSQGVDFVYDEEVEDFTVESGQIISLQGTKDSYKADEYLLATGAWSGKLLKKLNINLLIQGGKGYSFDLPEVQSIKVPSILCEAKVAVTPMNGFTRFAGTMEINDVDLSVSPNRVDGIIKSIRDFYPEISAEHINKAKVWRGLRPCSPDGLPYMGRSSKVSNLSIATGHAMMGLSMGPASGKLASEIVAKKSSSISLDLMNPERF